MTPKKQPRRSRQQIHPYVDRDLRQRARVYCKARNISETALIEAALKDYLDDSKDTALLLRRLDRLERHDQRLLRDLDIQSEAFGVFVRLWCSYLPDITGPDQEAAKTLAATRYQRFLDLVGQQYAGGARLVDLIVKPEAANEAELQAAVTGSKVGGP